MGLPFTHLSLHIGGVFSGHVGRIRDEETDTPRLHGFQQVTSKEAYVCIVRAPVSLCHLQGIRRYFGSKNFPVPLEGNGNRDCSRSRTHVENSGVRTICEPIKRSFHQMLCFGPRNQHALVNEEIATKELLTMSDVLGRLSLQSLVEVAPVVNPPKLGQLVGSVRI